MTHPLRRDTQVILASFESFTGGIRLHGRDDYIIHDHVFTDSVQRPVGKLAAVAALLSTWRRRFVTRRHLRALDWQGLADVGIDPASQEREAAKPFWRS